MDELYRYANAYFYRLESLQAYGGVSQFRLWIFVLALLFFVTYVVCWLPSLINGNTYQMMAAFFLLFVYEALVLMSFFALKHHRGSRLMAEVAEESGEACDSFAEAKRFILETQLNCDSHQFLGLANEMESALELAKRGRGELSVLDNIVSLVYTPDSKQRILALFILFFSIVLILSINMIEREMLVSYVMGGVSSDGFLQVLEMSFVVFAALLFALFLMKRELRSIFSMMWMWILGRDEYSVEKVRYLINDLNLLHRFSQKEANEERGRL